MALDPVVNFFRSTIATLPLNSGTTTMVLASGDGNKLPNPSVDGAFNLVVYNPSDPFVAPEIVRCTARTSDTLTISRGQEGTSDATKAAGIAWTVELVPTAKTIQDIDSTKVNVADIVDNLTSTDTNKPLSANQGKVLQDGKVAKAGDTMTGTLTATKLIPSGNVTAGNGMYLPDTNQIAIGTNGAEAIRVDASGNVGIGTSAPVVAVGSGLNISGNYGAMRLTWTGTANSGFIEFVQNTTQKAFIQYRGSTSGNERLEINNIANTPTLFFTNDTERLRITSAGDVGIGNTAPASKLHVTGLTRSTSGINFNASGGSTLSSYEEGTFTMTMAPSAGFTATGNTVTARYTKIGNVVTVIALPDMDVPGSLGTYSNDSTAFFVQLSGLPFTILSNIQDRSAGALGACTNLGATNGYLCATGTNNTDILSIFVNKQDGSTRTSPTLTVSTNANLHIQFTYRTS